MHRVVGVENAVNHWLGSESIRLDHRVFPAGGKAKSPKDKQANDFFYHQISMLRGGTKSKLPLIREKYRYAAQLADNGFALRRVLLQKLEILVFTIEIHLATIDYHLYLMFQIETSSLALKTDRYPASDNWRF
jgi:hypothetical protein